MLKAHFLIFLLLLTSSLWCQTTSLDTKVLDYKREINSLEVARLYFLKADSLLSQSDIGEAKKYWDKGIALIHIDFGNKSVFEAECCLYKSKYFSYIINADSSFYFSSKALSICHQKKDSLRFIPVNKIYRAFAFSIKTKYIQEGKVNVGAKLSRIYFDSALYYNNKYFSGNTDFETSVQTDIGNTYTDEVAFFKTQGNQKEANRCLISANIIYDKEIKKVIAQFGNKNQRLSSIYFVKGLSYSYCFPLDSLDELLNIYQKGICALTVNFNDYNILSCPDSKSNFINKSSTLILLRFKIDALHSAYLKTKNIKYLQACYFHSKTAFIIWESAFKNLKSEDINQALELYGAAPFGSSIQFCSEYYQLTKDKTVAEDVFRWMDLNKYSVLLKQQLDNKIVSFESNISTVSQVQKKLNSNEAIVEYYYNGLGLSCSVITEKSFDLYSINDFNYLNSTADLLLLSLKKHDAPKFCSNSKQLYDFLLAPFIKNLPSEINHLIIIPHAKLSIVPFDAFVLNNCKNYKNADYLIKHYQISYALSSGLLFSNNDMMGKASRIKCIAPVFSKHSNLPFSNKLVKSLGGNNNITLESITDSSSNNQAILHLATHSFCDYTNSRNSYFLLSDDKKMFISELAHKKYNFPLAVLGACETASGNIEAGEGVINFSRQLYLAGTKSTITTLWKVDDEATAYILGSFYNELSKGDNSIQSLHTAKLKYIESGNSIEDYDPYYWAGIIYTGRAINLERNDGSNTNGWYYVLGIICLALSFILIKRKFF